MRHVRNMVSARSFQGRVQFIKRVITYLGPVDNNLSERAAHLELCAFAAITQLVVRGKNV